MFFKKSSLLIGAATVALMTTTAIAAPKSIGDADLYSGLSARSIGPATMSGRVAAIDVVAGDSNHIYVGSASGGVWHSIDGGMSWQSLFDKQPVASIGALAINQSNPDIIWVGSGEGNVRNSVSVGNGMYRSVDGGKTWAHLGLPDSEHINRIALDPTNPDVAYVAAMGHLWSDGGERGVYKTTDGGKSWKLVLKGENAQSGATDVKIDPNNPNNLYASMWQFRRYTDYFKSGGTGSGLHVSHDGGETWRELSEEDGLPKGELGRSVFTVSPSDSNTVYALVEAKKSAIIRTDDGGRTWRQVNKDKGIANRPFYYMELMVDPNDKETIYNIATTLKVSNNGGKNFETLDKINCCGNPRALHIDLHSLWINPADSNHMILGNDGGLGITRDKGKTWRFVSNLPLAQFYHINVDNDLPYNIYGGLQDNGSFRGPSSVWENGGIRNFHWQEIGFGDGFDAAADPDDSMQGYSMSQGGSLSRWNLHTGERRNIRPNAPDVNTELRFNWNSGFAQDPFNKSTIYYGSQFLHKSMDKGASWETVSDDLTRNDKELMRFKKSGGITADVTAAENWQSITAIAPSAMQKDLIWIGTDDGRVHITLDGGKTYTAIADKVRGVVKGSWVPHIEPSPHDPSVAFVVFDDHRRGSVAPHAYRVEKYGKKWTSITTKDVTGYALSIQQDHVDPNLLFLGTEFGLHVSHNAGKSWMKWTAGVPTVSVMDMAIQERDNDLVLGTHGRALYVIDDYSALRGLKDADFKERLKLLSATDGIAYETRQTPGTRFVADTAFIGKNKAYGSMITFIASGDDLPHPDAETEKTRKMAERDADAKKAKKAKKDDKKDDKDEKPTKPVKVKVEVSDASGKVIRTFTRKVHQGINRLSWDMREDGGMSLRKSKPDADKRAGFDVVPGDYTITMTLGETKASDVVTVKADPRMRYTQENYQARIDYVHEIQALNDQAVMVVKKLRASKKDAETIKAMADAAAKKAKDDEDKVKSLKALSKQAGDLSKALKTLEERFVPQDRSEGIHYSADKVMRIIGNAMWHAGSYYGEVGDASKAFRAKAEAELAKAVAEVDAAYAGDVKTLREAFVKSGLGLLSE